MFKMQKLCKNFTLCIVNTLEDCPIYCPFRAWWPQTSFTY